MSSFRDDILKKWGESTTPPLTQPPFGGGGTASQTHPSRRLLRLGSRRSRAPLKNPGYTLDRKRSKCVTGIDSER